MDPIPWTRRYTPALHPCWTHRDLEPSSSLHWKNDKRICSNNYAKSSRLHLQTMLDLPATHSWVYENFAAKGFHIVRRSDRFWAGLWTDLIIEQVMMRAVKILRGLTRGIGVSENVRVMWINSMHWFASVHNAMCTLTELQHKTSEQHIELGVSRVKRDNDDLKKLQNWLQIHNPFDKN